MFVLNKLWYLFNPFEDVKDDLGQETVRKMYRVFTSSNFFTLISLDVGEKEKN